MDNLREGTKRALKLKNEEAIKTDKVDKVYKGLSSNVKTYLKSLVKSEQIVKIELLQAGKSPIIITTELTKGCKNDEVSGTLTYRLLSLYSNAREFKQNLGGFSFARKFDLSISIDGQSANGSKTLNGGIQTGVTLQNNEKSFAKFHRFVQKLTEDILTGDSRAEGTFSELMEGNPFNLAEVQSN